MPSQLLKVKEKTTLEQAKIVSIDRNTGRVSLFMKNGMVSVGSYLYDLNQLREGMTVLVGRVDNSYVILNKMANIPRTAKSFSFSNNVNIPTFMSTTRLYNVTISGGTGKYSSLVGKIGDDQTGYYVFLTSSDYGMTWIRRLNSFVYFMSPCISRDGSCQVVIVFPIMGGGDYRVYRSIDYGETWEDKSPPIGAYSYLAMSKDGAVIIACSVAAIYISNDYGETWINRTPTSPNTNVPFQFTSVVCDEDGSTILVGLQWNNNFVFVSNDYGITWFDRAVPCTGTPYSTTIMPLGASADGSFLVVKAAAPSELFVSNNSGATWTKKFTADYAWQVGWGACNDTGNQIIISTLYGDNAIRLYLSKLYLSIDSGETWAEQEVPVLTNGYLVSDIRSNGNNLVIVDAYSTVHPPSYEGGHIYIMHNFV